MGVINRTTGNLNNKTRTVLRLSQPESIVGDGTYKSPGTYVVEVNAALTENISYVGGSAVYNGTEDIQLEIESTYTVEASSAGTTIIATTGVNGTEDTDFEQDNTMTNPNEEKTLKQVGVHLLSNGDTFDFFIKGNNNFTINKAVWKIRRFD